MLGWLAASEIGVEAMVFVSETMSSDRQFLVGL